MSIIETSPSDKRTYKTIVLENKLTCLLIHDDEADKASAAMDVRVGHLSDPLAGLAHFCEHMLFLGTQKYPHENAYNLYLNQHGGMSNAFTDMESTNYYFDVSSDQLEGALDRFAQFFIEPLFEESCTQREMQAVDSEHAKNLQNDMWRMFQLLKHVSNPKHAFHKFGSGNLQSLDVKGIRDSLLKFHAQYYSANVMKLVVLGNESLAQLEEWVRCYFDKVPNQDLPIPTFDATRPFTSNELGKVLKVVPIHEVRTIEMHFPLGEIDSLYESKPTRYLSHLIGHEGKGSILSLLKAKGWANELSAGESQSCSDWSCFSITIDVTKEGLQEYQDVIHVVFCYLSMLLDKGPQEWIQNETATVADCSFRFLSKRNAMDYTSSLAGRMQTYPLMHVLAGPYRMYKYEPQFITDILTKLNPNNVLLVLADKSFQDVTTETEPWYGTEYSIQDLDSTLVSKWTNQKETPEWMQNNNNLSLTLPERNDMICTNFDILQEDQFPKDEPKLLMDSKTCRLWYKPDNVFEMPKVNICAQLQTCTVYTSPQASVLSYLWIQILQEHANEFTYLASMAGLHCELSHAKTGVQVHVSGYNHKVSRLVERIVKTMVEFPTKTSQDLFDRIKTKVQLEYENFTYAQPYQHGFYLADMILEHEKWSMQDKLEALQETCLDDLIQFASRQVLARFHLEMLIHGNVQPEQAKELASLFLEGLKPCTPLASHLPQVRVVQLRNDDDLESNFVHQIKEFNPENTNSCLAMVFQMGPMDLETNAALSFLHHLIKEPAFNELRTEEQLGYIVHTAIKTSGDNIKGLLFLIQSDSFDPIHLKERVDAFCDRFRSKLVEMNQEEFQSNIDAVVKSFLEKNKNLGEESTKYWNVILNRSYVFKRYQLIGEFVGKLTKDTMLRFFDKFVARNGPRRQVLSVQVFATNHQDQMDKPLSEDETLIEDIVEFKRQMPLFPLPKMVDVSEMKI